MKIPVPCAQGIGWAALFGKTMDGSVVSDGVEEVESFCYLGNVLDRLGAMKRAVRAKVATA